MPHFFISSQDVKNNKITISDKENYIHIAKSLRIKKGEQLLLIDENQIQYETVVEEITNKEITVDIKNSYRSVRRLGFRLYLAQSPLRSDAQSIIIEKATELGADGIYPVLTDNCALNKSVVEKKISKWQRIMYEASKQCERAYTPTCYELTNLLNVIKLKDEGYKVIAFCERLTDLSLHKYCVENPIVSNDKVVIIIGPEWVFRKEFILLEENKIPMLTLGDLILKAETAVIVALGNVIYEFENYRKN
ncbi:MAG: RsmE family RNA methyltransferase [Candidatus Gastranaerophilaceae bacterium]